MMFRSRRTPSLLVLPVAVAALLALLIGSCCPEDPFVPTPPVVEVDSARQAYLRVVIADLELQPVYTLLDDERIFCAPLAAFDYPEEIYQAEYLPVDTATSNVSFTRVDGSVLASESITLPKGSFHTVYLYRTEQGDWDIVVTQDDPTAKPGAGSVRYRIVHFAVGAPEVDIILVNKANTSDVVKIENLGYGDTTELLTQSSGIPNQGKTLTVIESATGDTIIVIPTVVFFGDAVNTLVMVGKLRPRGNEKFLFFNVFPDSRAVTTPPTNCNVTVPLLPGTPLYGFLPLSGLELSALRFFNATSSGGQTLDLALQSVFGQGFPDQYRRNFPGQPEATIDVSPLGSTDGKSLRKYFFLSMILEQSYPFRVEVHIAPPWDAATVQPILVPGQPLTVEGSGRYTVIAYGEAVAGQAGAALLFDRTPAPPSGSGAFRLFHGAFGQYEGMELRLRVNGNVGPAMAYGESPDPVTHSFTAPASGGSTISVLDPDGNVIATETGVTIDPDTTYTVILSRGPDGDRYVITVVDDNVVD